MLMLRLIIRRCCQTIAMRGSPAPTAHDRLQLGVEIVEIGAGSRYMSKPGTLTA